MKKTAQVNTCFVLLLVALSLHGISGEGEMDANCTSSSDCDYSHGKCLKPDQCEIGRCDCASGYVFGSSGSGKLCKKLKKIGDRCDVIYDHCYDGSCKGLCACPKGKHASDDRKYCVGNKYGEACRSGGLRFNNNNWIYPTCETSKGLTCDTKTYKCVCAYGKKHVGDHCEYYKKGEGCDLKKTCARHLTCVSGKCACVAGMKEFTRRARSDGVEQSMQMCINEKATTDVAQMGECNMNFIDTTTKICGDYLVCGVCRDWANEWSNNTKCISGVAELSTSKMALVSLLIVSLVAQLH